MISFQQKIQEQFNLMSNRGKLYKSNLTGDEVWDLYLNSFEDGNDPIFRDPESSTHNCNHCKNFIRRYGNIIALDDSYDIITMFDVEVDEEYRNVANVLSKKLKESKILNVFVETYDMLNRLPYEKCSKSNSVFRLGIDKNVKRYTREEAEKFGVVKPNEIKTFHHMFLDIDKQYVDMSGKSAESIIGLHNDNKNVFKRGLDEISIDTLYLVRDLINQGSLLNGDAHLHKVDKFISFKETYDNIPSNKKDNWAWDMSYNNTLAKFRNELIGVLCTELSEGEELNKACLSWNKRVDPANYMKATAPITQKQIDEAKQFVEENGYTESFNRRMATMDDIKVSEILHSNVGDGTIKNVSIFDNLKPNSTRHKRNEFDKVEEVSIDKFMKDILPTCNSVEAYLSNDLEDNMVTLTTAIDKQSKPIFKWNNNYSWTFNGNLAGKSEIKDAIEARGGKTRGVLNIRLHFPNTKSDYDLHVIEPNGWKIYYSNLRRASKYSGVLDLDAQGIDGSQEPKNRVENVIYSDKKKMGDGIYKVIVNNFSKRDENYGFNLEIETEDGDITSFNYNEFIKENNNVHVADIELKNGVFKVIPKISSSNATKEIYGLNSNQFHKVNLICLSPNHWNDNNVGNKHYLFMLEDCKSPKPIRSFHIENILPELAKHRKVLEVLGDTYKVESTDKQLSGLGFNATVRDELIVKLTGSHKRIIKIKF